VNTKAASDLAVVLLSAIAVAALWDALIWVVGSNPFTGVP
jgi:hypothetical protein